MPNVLPLVRRVRPADPPKTLIIDWRGGGRDSVDLTGLIARVKAFAPLEDETEFRAVHIVEHGVGIEWDCGLDLSGSTLTIMADEQRPMPAAEFIGFLTDYKISNREAADLFDRSLSTIKNWRSGKTDISSTASIAVRTMIRDEVVLLAHFRPQARGRPRKRA